MVLDDNYKRVWKLMYTLIDKAVPIKKQIIGLNYNYSVNEK